MSRIADFLATKENNAEQIAQSTNGRKDRHNGSGPVELLAGTKEAGESKRAIIACNDYLRMGPARSVAELVRRYKGDIQNNRDNLVASSSTHTLYTWSYRFSWEGRAAIYDSQTDSRKDEVAEEILNAGLATSHERVNRLKVLAEHLEAELYEEQKLWLPDVKQIGTGKMARQVDLKRFNSQLVEQYRKVLDDLASETGGRIHKHDVTSNDEAIQVVGLGISLDDV